MRRHNHSPLKYTRRSHAILGPGSSPSVSLFRRQRIRPEGDILQVELRKINYLLSMVRIGRERRLSLGFLNEEIFPAA